MPKYSVSGSNILRNPECLSFIINFKGLHHRLALQVYKNAFLIYKLNYGDQYYKQHKAITIKRKK